MENWASLAPAAPDATPEGLFAGLQREEHLRILLGRLPEKERAALLTEAGAGQNPPAAQRECRPFPGANYQSPLTDGVKYP
jgi:hypothetical protein